MAFARPDPILGRAEDGMADRHRLQDFDEAMLRFYAIDHADAGMDRKELR